jgi:Superfamily II DNA and RNA helicases
LDIPNVQHVVHYQVPRTSESYVHRSGRTARAQKQGLTLLLIEPSEAQFYTRFCQTLGRSKDLPLFPVESNALDVAKRRVVLARDVDRIELASRRSTSETGWFRKALTEMDMLVDEDDLPRQLDDDECNINRKLAARKKKQLNSLLSKPLFVCNTSHALDFLSSAKKNVSVKRKHKKKRNKKKE